MAAIAIEARLITKAGEFDELQPEWDRLLEVSGESTLFQSWDWIRCWIAEYVQDGKLFVVALYDECSLVAVAPFWIDSDSIVGLTKARVLRFLGTGDACSDQLDFILQSKSRQKWLQELWNQLWTVQVSRWDVLELSAISVQSPTLDYCMAKAEDEARCITTERLAHEICPYMTLPDSWDQFMSELSKSRRYAISMSRKRLGEQAAYGLIWCEDPEHIGGFMDDLKALNTEVWQTRGHTGSFATKAFDDFHRKLAARQMDKSGLVLCSLVQGNEHLGTFYGMLHQGTLYNYIFTVRKNPEKRISNGDVLLSGVLETMISKGARELDFLRGDEAYKSLWTATDRRQTAYRMYNRNVRSLALAWSRQMREILRTAWRYLLP